MRNSAMVVAQTRARGKRWLGTAAALVLAVCRRQVGAAERAQCRQDITPANASGDAGPQPPRSTAKIAFLRRNNVWVAGADGRNPRQLTKDGTSDGRGME